MYDFLVIGGGVIGTFLARELSHYEGTTILIEKENDLSQIQTTHNSALVHSPVVTPPESGKLKSRLSREGNAVYHQVAGSLGVPVNKNGALMVASSYDDIPKLKEYLNKAKARGIEDVSFLDYDALHQKEKNLNKSLVAGLDMPSAMTADTYKLTHAVANNAKRHGAVFALNEEVVSISHDGELFHVTTRSQSTYKARYVFNAAGTHNARIAGMIEKSVPYKMEPRRGDYYVLDASQKDFMKHTIFPLPTSKGKGVLIVPQPDGTIRLGPTSIYQEDLDDNTVSLKGLQEVRNNIDNLATNVPFDNVTRTYAGIRSTINKKDFYIKASLEIPQFIHVAGIDSPGVTAAPAIARYTVEEVLGEIETLQKKITVDPLAQ